MHRRPPSIHGLAMGDYCMHRSSPHVLAMDPGPVLDNDLQTPSPQKEPMIRYFLAYVSDDFKTKKKCIKEIKKIKIKNYVVKKISIFFFKIQKYF